MVQCLYSFRPDTEESDMMCCYAPDCSVADMPNGKQATAPVAGCGTPCSVSMAVGAKIRELGYKLKGDRAEQQATLAAIVASYEGFPAGDIVEALMQQHLADEASSPLESATHNAAAMFAEEVD